MLVSTVNKMLKIKWTWVLYTCIILIVIIAIGSLLFSSTPGTFTRITDDINPAGIWLDGKTLEETKRFESKGEATSRECLQQIYGLPFQNIRLAQIKNPNTGKPLEIDCYNAQLKIGLEYHGVNHYRFVPFFHKTMEAFLKSQERDAYKVAMCKKLGIVLIIVPYNCLHSNICPFIRRELRRHGKLDHETGWNDEK